MVPGSFARTRSSCAIDGRHRRRCGRRSRSVRRLVPRRLSGVVAAGAFLDWASVEPFTGHVPTVRLRVPHPKLARLHPAQLADLVEAASHLEGAEIIEAVGRDDPERQADVIEELESEHQLEFVEDLPDPAVAELVTHMEADDAADLLAGLPSERVEAVVGLLPGAHRRRVRTLLGYDPATAGGLMSPDFVCLYSQATQAEALARIRSSSHTAADALAWIFVMNSHKRLTGAVALADLVQRLPTRLSARSPRRLSAFGPRRISRRLRG